MEKSRISFLKIKWYWKTWYRLTCCILGIFSTKCNICTSRAYAMMPIRVSVTEVHWHIIANLGFKF